MQDQERVSPPIQILSIAMPSLREEYRLEVPLNLSEQILKVVGSDSNLLGALGEKLFLEYIVPKFCRGFNYALNATSLLYLQNYIARKYGERAAKELLGNYVATLRSTHRYGSKDISIHKLRDGEMEDFITGPVTIINRSIEAIRVNLKFYTKFSYISYTLETSPHGRIERLRHIVYQYPVLVLAIEEDFFSITPSSELREHLIRLASKFTEKEKKSLIMNWKKIVDQVVQKLQKTFIFENIPLLDEAYFDFMCIDAKELNKELQFIITTKLCHSITSDDNCVDVIEHIDKIRLNICSAQRLRLFEVKTSLRLSELTDIADLFSVTDSDYRYRFTSLEKALKLWPHAEYFIVFVHPLLDRGKASMVVYRYHR